jgi:SAM-dependent methyltransferase
MHLNSELLFARYAKGYFRPGMRVLEIGPDGFPSAYRKSINDSSIGWDTLDLHENPQLTHRARSPYEFPIPDATYDIAVSGQVIEHVGRIWVWIREVARVVKPGGMVITINPVSWPYHRFPIDCWRIYPDGMKALYEDASLEVLFSAWECLETPQYRTKPGRSLHTRSRKSQMIWSILGKLGARVEAAYDTVTIGKKRG